MKTAYICAVCLVGLNLWTLATLHHERAKVRRLELQLCLADGSSAVQATVANGRVSVRCSR